MWKSVLGAYARYWAGDRSNRVRLLPLMDFQEWDGRPKVVVPVHWLHLLQHFRPFVKIYDDDAWDRDVIVAGLSSLSDNHLISERVKQEWCCLWPGYHKRKRQVVVFDLDHIVQWIHELPSDILQEDALEFVAHVEFKPTKDVWLDMRMVAPHITHALMEERFNPGRPLPSARPIIQHLQQNEMKEWWKNPPPTDDLTPVREVPTTARYETPATWPLHIPPPARQRSFFPYHPLASVPTRQTQGDW